MQIRRTTTVQNTNAVNLQKSSKTTAPQTGTAIPVDQLDISAEAQRIQANGGIRTDRVEDLRAQIAQGQYETPEKIESAVERMLDELV